MFRPEKSTAHISRTPGVHHIIFNMSTHLPGTIAYVHQKYLPCYHTHVYSLYAVCNTSILLARRAVELRTPHWRLIIVCLQQAIKVKGVNMPTLGCPSLRVRSYRTYVNNARKDAQDPDRIPTLRRKTVSNTTPPRHERPRVVVHPATGTNNRCSNLGFSDVRPPPHVNIH